MAKTFIPDEITISGYGADPLLQSFYELRQIYQKQMHHQQPILDSLRQLLTSLEPPKADSIEIMLVHSQYASYEIQTPDGEKKISVGQWVEVPATWLPALEELAAQRIPFTVPFELRKQ